MNGLPPRGGIVAEGDRGGLFQKPEIRKSEVRKKSENIFLINTYF